MQVNSIASYSNTLQNRTNVKFGDCKKIVCEESMLQAQKAFEKNTTWKPILDKLYDYEVHFISDVPKEHPQIKGKNYMMILSPYKHSSLDGAKSNDKEKLPKTLFLEANSLEDIYSTDKYIGIRDFYKRTYKIEYGLINKIKNFSIEEVMDLIK